MNHTARVVIRALRMPVVLAALLASSVTPAHARSRGCSVQCELQSAVGGLLIGLFFLYGLLVLNTGTRIGIGRQLLYVAATVATGALTWTVAYVWLGMAPWPAAAVMVVLVLAMFVYLFNPRRHRPKP